MNNTFDRQIEAARQRLDTWQQRTCGSPEQTALVREVLEEFYTALEELHAAGEELRQQNDELVASRQAVEVERQRYAELFDFAPGSYLVTDPEGVIQTANRAAGMLLGAQPEFLAGKPLLLFVAEQDHPIFHAWLTDLQSLGPKASGTHLGLEIAMQPRDGAGFAAALTVGLARDADGRLTGLRWLLRDISERVRTEERLAWLASFPELNPNPVIEADLSGRIHYLNPAAERLFPDLIAGSEHPWVKGLERIADTFHRGERNSVLREVTLGESCYEQRLHYVAERQRVRIYSIDITERKLAEEALRQVQQRLQDSNEQLQSRTRELQTLTEELRQAHDELEQRVQERTAELAQANAELRRAFAYNRSLIEASLDPLVTIGPDGKITDVNTATEHLTGRSRVELIGTDFSDYFTEPEKARAGHQQVFRDGAVRDYELAVRHRDERVTPVLYNATVYQDEAGNIVGVFAAARDITRRKLAQEQLRLQSAALEAAANGIIITDRQGNILWANPAFTQMTGYSALEVLGQNPRLFKSGQNAPDFYGQLWETILSWKVWRGEIINRRKDGSLYTEEQTITPVLDIDGEISHFIAIKQDVTERKRAEAALRQSEEQFRTVADFTYDWETWVGTDGNYIYVSPSCERITGYRADEFSQDPRLLETILHPDDRAAIVPHLHERSDSGEVFSADLRIITRSGEERWINHICQPVYGVDRRWLGRRASNRDITDRKQAEEEIKRLYERELRARQIAETLSAAGLALTRTLDLETVMETLLDSVGRLVPYDSANVMLLETESRLAVRVTRGYERWADAQQVRAIAFDVQTNPILNELLTTRRSSLISDSRALPGWERRPGVEHVRSWIGVPLIAGGHVIGIHSLDKTEPGFFTQEHVRLAEMLVGQAAVAIQNAWLFEQVRAGHERLQSLSRRLVEVQEAERRYVARELHDEAGQSLTSLVFGLGQLEQETDRSRHTARIAELKQMTHEVLEDLHRLAVDLRPASLDHLGLVPALEQYVRMTGDRYRLIAQFKALGFDGGRLPPAMETALYRIVQEGLTNAVRHAQATRVDVLLERRGDQVVVVIEDDGVGFDADMARFASSGRLGLLGMQERVEMLGGSLVIESAAGAGTTIVAEVPYADSHSHRG